MNDKIFYFILLTLLFITFKIVWDYIVVGVMRRDLEHKLIKINIAINEYSKKNKVNNDVHNLLNGYIHKVENCINELSLIGFIVTKIFTNKKKQKYIENENHIKVILGSMDKNLKKKLYDINFSILTYTITRSSFLMMLLIFVAIPLIILITLLMLLGFLSKTTLTWFMKRGKEKVLELADVEQTINFKYNESIKTC